ncbi:hypothetical protein BO94DRAFT_548431 [Aspergillus sclerotioniger CBS 115572]|uniref:ER-bound oxygenase mpaB/mpaB'/Rubber oxygenase catalytic domain-containing protein n=1 Tax=Aspergillus sclerotioniger CBS 115572 TaxID=1450535 RepID=A0A317W1D5_9EURO|nr:hypothetical protein BO94DRAFT_548431 [Aspergillus sclerotioniger CBS 115572]PWY80454.1 hypothetical protein BO94DRAFT_548431 [Aspergillus sclerotioniger CBS 115572]
MSPSNLRSYWDYTFLWTDLHQTKEQLRPRIYTYDRLADECLERLDVLAPETVQDVQNDAAGPKKPRRDMHALMKDHARNDPKLGELWTQVNTVPEWVDWQQIQRGQDVFFRYGLPILNALNFGSLLGGISDYNIPRGSARVVETLARTGGFSADVVRRRLLETLQFVLQVSESLDAIKPGGAGHVSSIRVRLLHASVRSRILSLAKNDPDYYNVDECGVPINDLDCIATINTFSSIVIWVGLPRQGIWLRKQEINDYLALWRLVAYYMGTPDTPFASQPSGRAMMESLTASEFNPTDVSKLLAHNIILGLEKTAPTYASKEFMEAMARYLNGRQLSDRLGIPQTNLYYRSLIYGYRFFVMTLAYGTRLFPTLDQTLIAFRRKLYYTMITDREKGLGGESFYAFQYVPSYGKTTSPGKRRSSKPAAVGIEAVAQLGLLAALLAAVVVFSGGIYALRILTPAIL